MHYVTSSTPTPVPGTVLHLLYLSEDHQLTERLVRLVRVDATHWRAIDLLKQEFRCFRRAGLFWAKSLTDFDEQQDVFYRLVVHQLHAEQLKKKADSASVPRRTRKGQR